MQLLKQIMFQARAREEEGAMASATSIVTYRVLAKSVLQAVDRLAALGLSRGSLVLIEVKNPHHHVYLMLALGLLGLASASLSGTEATIAIGPKAALLLTDRDDGGQREGVMSLLVDDSWFAGDPAAPADYTRLLALPGFATPDDVARYINSSGTTGQPKCVAVSAAVLERRLRNTMATVVGRQSPMAPVMMLSGFTTGAAPQTAMRTLLCGGMVCFAPNPAVAIDLIRLFHVESLSGSVAQVQTIIEQLRGRAPLASLRSVVVFGSRVPRRLLAEARAKLSPDIAVAYGSTELGVVAFARGAILEQVEGVAGYVLPHMEVEAVDEAGKPLPAGREGVLRVRSPDLAGYADEGGAPVAVAADGWFYPGDVGQVQPDGLLLVSGRTNDVINIGGVITAPEMIEEAFLRNRQVKDAAALRIDGPNGRDEVWVAVVTDEATDIETLGLSVRAVLHERAPTRVVRVAAIPRNVNGKIQRNLLRQELLSTVPKA